MNFKRVCQGLASFLPRPPQTRPPPLPQGACAMLTSSGARPSMKRSADESEPPSADESEPPTSTSAADAVQSMMEEDTKQGQNGPSNRSGCVLVLHDENVLGGGVLPDESVCGRDKSKKHRSDDMSSNQKWRRVMQREAEAWRRELQYNSTHQRVLSCASCQRNWRTTTTRKNLDCQWCKKGPLCWHCRLGFAGHPPSCNACAQALPASRMVDVFPVDIETVRAVAARWALISARVVSAHAATRE